MIYVFLCDSVKAVYKGHSREHALYEWLFIQITVYNTVKPVLKGTSI
jgi:hypothetical protein